MKKNPILLVMLAILLAFSFSVIGCDDGGGDEPGPGPNPGGSHPQWPADIAYDDSVAFGSQGLWGVAGTTFSFSNFGTDTEATVRIGIGWDVEYYDLTAIEGKKFTVKKQIWDEDFNLTYGTPFVFCTDYTITGEGAAAKLTFTGATGDIATWNSVELSR